MMPGNPAFGSTVLRIPAEQSPNFVTGVSGWFIGQDGHIEANDATIRGTITAGEFDGTDFIINSDGAFYYSGMPAAGNLIASNAPAAGTDTFGNVYNAGVQSYIPGIGAAGLAAGKLNLYQWTGSAWSAYGGLVADGTALDVNNTNGGGVKIPNGPFTSTAGAAASPTVIETDIWTDVTPPTGFTGLLRYRMRAEKDVEVEAQLAVGTTAGTGTITLISLGTAYTPASTQRGSCGVFCNGTPSSLAAVQGIMDLRWSANPAGTFTLQAFPGGASGTGVTECSFNIRYALD